MRLRLGLALALGLALSSSPAAAVNAVTVTAASGQIVATASLGDADIVRLRSSIHECVSSSVTYGIEFRSFSRWWIDRRIGAGVVRNSASCDATTRRYRILQTVDGRIVQQATLDGPGEVVQFLRTLNAPFLDDAPRRLMKGSEYVVSVLVNMHRDDALVGRTLLQGYYTAP